MNKTQKNTDARKSNSQYVDCADSPEPVFAEICMLWQSNIGALNPIIADEIKDFMLEIPTGLEVEWFREAIKLACSNNVRKWSYVKAILKKWTDNGEMEHQRQRQEESESPSPLPPTPDLPPPEPLPPYAALWEQAAGILRSQLTKAAYDQVLGQCTPQPNHNGTFVLGAPAGICPQVERVRRQILIALKQFKPDIKELEVINL